MIISSKVLEKIYFTGGNGSECSLEPCYWRLSSFTFLPYRSNESTLQPVMQQCRQGHCIIGKILSTVAVREAGMYLSHRHGASTEGCFHTLCRRLDVVSLFLAPGCIPRHLVEIVKAFFYVHLSHLI